MKSDDQSQPIRAFSGRYGLAHDNVYLMGHLQRSVVALRALVGIVLWIPSASAAGVSLDSATWTQKMSAQSSFRSGKKAYEDKKFEEALKAFRASYEEVASPNSHLMMARTLRELDRPIQAFVEFELVIDEAQAAAKKAARYERAAEAARKELNELRAKVGFVVFEVSGETDGTELFVDDELISREQWDKEIPVRVGTIKVTAKSPGKKAYSEEVTIAAGTRKTYRLDFAKMEASSPPPLESLVDRPQESSDVLGMDKHTWTYVAGGVGAAGTITFGVFGAMARSKYKSLESDCHNHVCPTDRSDDIDAGKRNQTIANVALVVGVVWLGTAAALYFLPGDKKKGREKPTHQLGFGPGSVRVQGTF